MKLSRRNISDYRCQPKMTPFHILRLCNRYVKITWSKMKFDFFCLTLLANVHCVWKFRPQKIFQPLLVFLVHKVSPFVHRPSWWNSISKTFVFFSTVEQPNKWEFSAVPTKYDETFTKITTNKTCSELYNPFFHFKITLEDLKPHYIIFR